MHTANSGFSLAVLKYFCEKGHVHCGLASPARVEKDMSLTCTVYVKLYVIKRTGHSVQPEAVLTLESSFSGEGSLPNGGDMNNSLGPPLRFQDGPTTESSSGLRISIIPN